MKTLLQAFALFGIASLSTSAFAQESCSEDTKPECSATADAALASAEDGDCSSAKAEACSQAGELASAKDGECSSAKTEACSQAGELASAKDGECSSAKAEACSQAGELASTKDGECSSARAEACSQTGELASAGDDAHCGSAKPVIPASAQLATLIQPNRVAGVVVGGKAYLGSKAVAVVDGLVRAQLSTKIAAVCEESRSCSKTLASNVDKTLASGVCMKTEFSALLASGAIDSLIIEEESHVGEAALASLTKITSCEKFKAECATRAGVKAPKVVEVVESKPMSVDSQLAALVKSERVSGVVIDGKSYSGAEANAKLAGLIRGNVEGMIKEKCEVSRACEQTLATNVDKALAGDICAGTQLASLIESGRIQGVVVKGETLAGAEASNAVSNIMACPEFKAECHTLASAPVAECSSEAEAECSTEAKAECSSAPKL